ncbi:hypothetical protein EDM52_23535 [Brevibacillus invocatus]|uniref:TniQ family protein n=1 Tax=Brevibacillus invocatus TaxID=173959 RepID=A0A3M8BSA4_9BACL|nr:hypothetical protein [Brevibacillus invocatus]RNB66289.1 hypothetical protein EDM52_23535 [Brevibacillus invocatus]
MFKSKSFTWNQKWINQYESSWSIFEKFKYSNVVKSSDLLTIFTTKLCNNQKKSSWSKVDRDLLNLVNIDDDKCKAVFGVSLHSHNKNLINKLIEPYLNIDFDNNNYFRDNLTFCIQCMQNGFHSLFHQFHTITKCPFHLNPLSLECPDCKCSYSFALTDNNWSNPFCCKCGYWYADLKDRHYLDIWKNHHSEIADKNLQHWISTRERSEYYIDLRSIYRSKIVKQETPCLPLNPNNKFVVYNKKDYLGIRRFGKVEYNYNLENEIDKSTKSVQKAIVRRVRRHIIRKHRSCVIRLVRGFPDETICPFAYAYVLWRQKIDNFKQYWQVDNSKLYRYQLDSSSLENVWLSTNLSSLLTKVERAFDCNSTGLFFWILNSYYGESLLQLFKEFLIEGQPSTNRCIFVDYPQGHIETIPNIIIREVNDNSTMKKIEFLKSSHMQPSISEIIDRMECPFNQGDKLYTDLSL